MQRRGRLGPGARVFDLGAHQGVVALMLAGIVGPEGQVIAVEAVPHNARIATQNATANACRQLVVLHAAVLVAPGEAGDFAPLAAGVALLGARCRIVALAPRTPEITSHV
ncbi:MAG TPA: FkbM family methyltransferase [Gemmatimonadaceae bacterium]